MKGLNSQFKEGAKVVRDGFARMPSHLSSEGQSAQFMTAASDYERESDCEEASRFQADSGSPMRMDPRSPCFTRSGFPSGSFFQACRVLASLGRRPSRLLFTVLGFIPKRRIVTFP